MMFKTDQRKNLNMTSDMRKKFHQEKAKEQKEKFVQGSFTKLVVYYAIVSFQFVRMFPLIVVSFLAHRKMKKIIEKQKRDMVSFSSSELSANGEKTLILTLKGKESDMIKMIRSIKENNVKLLSVK